MLLPRFRVKLLFISERLSSSRDEQGTELKFNRLGRRLREGKNTGARTAESPPTDNQGPIRVNHRGIGIMFSNRTIRSSRRERERGRRGTENSNFVAAASNSVEL